MILLQSSAVITRSNLSWYYTQGWGEYTNPEYEYEYEYFA